MVLPKHASKMIRARADELRGVTLTEVIDKHSPCAKSTVVTTEVYSLSKKRRPSTQALEYESHEIVVHPELEVLKGTKAGRTETVWSNADLAVIFLKEPVELDFQPLLLPTAEVQVGDVITMVGFGLDDLSKPQAHRRHGDNKVTRAITLETGSVFFRAEEQRLSDGTVASHAVGGDSGGACVTRTAPNILVGIVSIGAQTTDGKKMSIFTSVFSHRAWLEQALKRANES